MLLRKAAQVFPLPLWTHLCSCALVASILKQVSHHIQVVLLSCHVQGSKSILQNTVTVSSFISASNWLVTIFTSEQFQNRCMFFFFIHERSAADRNQWEEDRLTWDWALMSAPRLTRVLTTSAWPAREEMWRAVFPFCTEKMVYLRLCQ